MRIIAENNLCILFIITTAMGSNNVSQIPGTYQYNSSSNFNTYLKELGVPWLLRTFAGMANPTIILSKECPQQESKPRFLTSQKEDPCLWTMRIETAFKNHEVQFHLDEEIKDHITMDGRVADVTYSIDGPNTLIEQQKGSKVFTKVVREFYPEFMKVKLMANDVVAHSTFKRVAEHQPR